MENLKPQELRIGNLVDWNGEIGIISQLLEMEVAFKCGECDLYEALKPIPLTEEWLLNFGYTKKYSNFWNLGHIVWECYDSFFICDKNGITLKYVHQLQNLYFAINGRELTVKKEE